MSAPFCKLKLAAALGVFALSSTVNALTISAFDGSNLNSLVTAIGVSGVTVVPGSISYTGSTGSTLASTQVGTYTGFNLSNDSGATRTLGNGVVLASGGLNFSTTTNTINNWASNGVTSNSSAILSTLSGGKDTNDASSLRFSFTAPTGLNAVSISFVFTTDEFPTQSVTDIFGYFIDGVNYAKFPNGALVQNQSGSSNFTTGWNLEFNGITQVLTAVGLLDSSKSVHTFEFGIADTNDRIFDSAVFISNFGSGTSGSTTGGVGEVITTTPGGTGGSVPLPGSVALLLAGIVGIGLKRKN
jgi:hypothetical protein